MQKKKKCEPALSAGGGGHGHNQEPFLLLEAPAVVFSRVEEMLARSISDVTAESAAGKAGFLL